MAYSARVYPIYVSHKNGNGKERASKTKNLDPSKSDRNLHLGPYFRGWDATQAIEEEVADYETEYKKTSYLNRSLRSDVAVAIALIIKPDGEVDKFLDARGEGEVLLRLVRRAARAWCREG